MAVESFAPPPKPARAVNALCAFGAAARRGRVIAVGDVIRLTSFGLDTPDDATRSVLTAGEDRRSFRVLKTLKKYGLRYEYLETPYSPSHKAGYRALGLLEPPAPGPRDFSGQWLWLLWAGARRLPVAEVCRTLGTDPKSLRANLASLSLCGVGPLPHELLDARIEGGLVVIEGPNPYAQVQSARQGDHRGHAGDRRRA